MLRKFQALTWFYLWKQKKRRRPKGCQFNVVGIPCKKSKKNYQTVPLKQLNVNEKQQKILSSIFDKEKAKIIFRNNKEVLLDDILDDASSLAYNLLDEDVDLNVTRKYFSEKVWKKFKKVNCFLGYYIQLNKIQWLPVQIPLRPTFDSYF